MLDSYSLKLEIFDSYSVYFMDTFLTVPQKKHESKTSKPFFRSVKNYQTKIVLLSIPIQRYYQEV